MKHTVITSLFVVLFMSACAKGPDSIMPVSMNGAFNGMDCNAASVELKNARANETALSAEQRSAVAGDAIGVLLLGIPTASLFGGDKEGQLAVEKGRVIALENRLKNC